LFYAPARPNCQHKNAPTRPRISHKIHLVLWIHEFFEGTDDLKNMKIRSACAVLGLLAGNSFGQCYQFSSGSAASIKVNFLRVPVPSSPSTGVYQYDQTSGLVVSAVVTLGQQVYSSGNVDAINVTVSDSASLDYSQLIISMGFTSNGATVGAGVHFGWNGNFFQGGKLPASLPSLGSANPTFMTAGANFADTQYTPTSITTCSGASSPPSTPPITSAPGPSAPGPSVPGPHISQNGVAPVGAALGMVLAPGEWFSIYGSSLAGSTASWSGDFPVSLGGVSVKVADTSAYLSYVSPTQINAQAPTGIPLGAAYVTVSNETGADAVVVSVTAEAPSFFLLDSLRHVSGVILKPDGAYDILGPDNSSLGFRTVSAGAGDQIALFGSGFGPTNPPMTAGKAITAVTQTANAVQLKIGSTTVYPSFAGLSESGVYQMNFVVPFGLGAGDRQIVATVNGASSSLANLISLH
jgi:uncharacterized protein (TIGR03437 family)